MCVGIKREDSWREARIWKTKVDIPGWKDEEKGITRGCGEARDS